MALARCFYAFVLLFTLVVVICCNSTTEVHQGEATETAFETLEREAATLPFTPHWEYEPTGCPEGVGAPACYVPDLTTIYVGDEVAAQAECRIREVFAHEWRHHVQDLRGQIVFTDDGSEILNREWLEADAAAFSVRYGCAHIS